MRRPFIRSSVNWWVGGWIGSRISRKASSSLLGCEFCSASQALSRLPRRRNTATEPFAWHCLLQVPLYHSEYHRRQSRKSATSYDFRYDFTPLRLPFIRKSLSINHKRISRKE